jgi:hypothetical protein
VIIIYYHVSNVTNHGQSARRVRAYVSCRLSQLHCGDYGRKLDSGAFLLAFFIGGPPHMRPIKLHSRRIDQWIKVVIGCVMSTIGPSPRSTCTDRFGWPHVLTRRRRLLRSYRDSVSCYDEAQPAHKRHCRWLCKLLRPKASTDRGSQVRPGTRPVYLTSLHVAKL